MKVKMTNKGLRLIYRKGNKKISVKLDVILLILIGMTLLVFSVKGIYCTVKHKHHKEITEVAVYEEVKEETQLLDIIIQSDNEVQEEQEAETRVEEVTKPVSKEVEPTYLDYRMTYYYPGDSTNSGNATASGKSTHDFQVNERGWYTYNGKLVVATASKRLLSWDSYKNSTQPTYNLYDELKLEIQGQVYEAVVLDVCGSCMKSNKIDLYVQDKLSGLDTQIKLLK